MHTERPQRNLHLWSGLILLGVFLAGAATGAGVFAWARPGPHRIIHHGGTRFLLHGLDLTPEQQEKVRTIMERHRSQVEAVMREGFPKIRAAQEAVDAELRAMLTPEQQKRFDQLRAQHPFPPPLGGSVGRESGFMIGSEPGMPGPRFEHFEPAPPPP